MNKDEWLDRLEEEGPDILKDALAELPDDKDFILDALKINAGALYSASEVLRNDMDVVLAAVTEVNDAKDNLE